MSRDETTEPGFLRRTITVANRDYPYSLHLPPDYTADRAWPCLLFLHGMGERGNDGTSHTRVGIGKAIEQHPQRFDGFVVMPQCPADQIWDDALQTVALACLEATQRDYRIDPDRVILTGLSMGAFGAWALGATEAHRFAALVPICGGGDAESAADLARLPIWCFHGGEDPVVAPQRSREMVAAVRKAGGRVTYTEYPGVGHNAWDPAYDDPAVIKWMLTCQRQP